MKSLKSLFNKLIQKGTEESSKRFISIWSMVLVSYIVGRFTSEENIDFVLSALLSFILTLLSVAAYEGIKTKNKSEIKKEENEKNESKELHG